MLLRIKTACVSSVLCTYCISYSQPLVYSRDWQLFYVRSGICKMTVIRTSWVYSYTYKRQSMLNWTRIRDNANCEHRWLEFLAYCRLFCRFLQTFTLCLILNVKRCVGVVVVVVVRFRTFLIYALDAGSGRFTWNNSQTSRLSDRATSWTIGFPSSNKQNILSTAHSASCPEGTGSSLERMCGVVLPLLHTSVWR